MNLEGRIRGLVVETRDAMSKLEALYGRELRGCRILDVGPGPFLLQAYVLGLKNEVTAIDLDVIPVGLSPMAYLRLLWKNGPFRTAKTIARKGLGIDRAYRRHLKRLLRISALPRVLSVQGDATASGFQDGSFDVVHSRALMQHVPNPELTTLEFIRVLKPQGVLYLSLHLYTSFNGSLDPRVMDERAGESLYWAHLRPSTRENITGECMLNKLRLSEWISLFSRVCPGHTREVLNSNREGVANVAERLVASGELPGYTVDELCAHALNIYWRKPAIT